MPSNAADRWFGRVMWAGIVANLALAVPTLAAPARMLALMSLPAAAPDLWLRFAALLLVLLSVFYMPAAHDPRRYRTIAWLATASRFVGFAFFLGQAREYLMLGLFDLAFFLPEVILLSVSVRLAGTAAGASPAPGSAA
jgi:hypothetical protein